MTTFKWTALGLALVILLSACGGTPTTSTVSLTLTPTPAQVASGGKVSLKATITEGAANVAAVDFAVKGGTVFAKDVKASADGSYSAESAAINATTIFVATAKDAGGAVLATAEAAVTINAVPQPNAEPKTVTTLAGVAVAGGTTPTGLAVTTEKLVVQNGTASLKGTATGGTAVINPDGTFTFTPADGATSGAFDYEVKSGTLSDTGKVTITIKALPDNTKVVTTMAQLLVETGAASTTEIIIIAGPITCVADNDGIGANGEYCFELKPNQRLLGSGVIGTGADSVTLTNPNAKLLIDLTNPSNAITGIRLAKGVTVEGLEISGVANQLYTAIRGIDTDFVGSADADLVTVKNVKIIGPTLNSPIGFTLSQQDSTYNMLIDGLTVENANKTIGFPAFKKLEIKNSTFNLAVASGNGIFLQSEGTSEVILENVKVNSSIATGALSAINFTQADDNDVMTVTVKDTAVTFTNDTDDATPFDLGAAVAFNFTYGAFVTVEPADGRLTILTDASTGNSTNATSGDALKYEVTESATNAAQAAKVIKGYIQGTPTSVFETRP